MSDDKKTVTAKKTSKKRLEYIEMTVNPRKNEVQPDKEILPAEKFQ